MRRLTAALLVALSAAQAPAADKDEDKAKDAAVAFLKAVKSKDADAAMKTVAAPLFARENEQDKVLKDEAAVKAWVKRRLEEVKDAEKVPSKVAAVYRFQEEVKDEEGRKVVEEVLGKDGFLVVAKANGRSLLILVRLKDGEGKVVGIGGPGNLQTHPKY
jgi:hypothetical protein